MFLAASGAFNVRWLSLSRWNIHLMCIITAPYLASTCKGLFLRSQPRKSSIKGAPILPFSWLLSEGYCDIHKNFYEIIWATPQKHSFLWLLSRETFSWCQINFWKNVKVFPFNCRVIIRGLFYKAHNHFWLKKYLRKRLYFAISGPCLYVGVLKKYKTFSKTIYWHLKSVLYIVRGLLYDAITLPTFNAKIFDLPVEKCPPAVATKWGVLASLLI